MDGLAEAVNACRRAIGPEGVVTDEPALAAAQRASSAFDLAVNAKTAQALGLTIPPHVLLQATEVIQ